MWDMVQYVTMEMNTATAKEFAWVSLAFKLHKLSLLHTWLGKFLASKFIVKSNLDLILPFSQF